MPPDPTPTVLIVDDDPGIAELERLRLEEAGYRTVTAASAAEGLAAVRGGGIDFVLLDYRLPGDMDGLDFYARLKAEGFDPPVVLVTGFSDEGTAIRALRAGVRDFVTKSAEYLDYLPEAVGRVLAQVRTERRLAESEAHLALVWERSIDGMRLTDAAGTVVRVNAAYARLVGIPAADLVGRPFTVAYDPAQAAAMAEAFRDRFAARAIEPHAEKEVTLRDGRRAWLELSNSFLEVPGRSSLLLSIVRDATARRHLEDQYRQAQKMEAIGQLAGGVAHDFNNLLTVINGYSEMLLAALPAGDRHRGVVEEVYRAGERAAMLTRQLLTFSRQEVVAPRVLDVNGVVEGAAQLLRRLIGEDIRLDTALAADLDRVTADPGQVEQVIMNLAVNARDAMPRGGRLTVETANVDLDGGYAGQHAGVAPGRYVLLAVSDTGHGMSPEVQRRIFEPFFTTKGQGKGTGLGLATVFGIVEQSGGHLGVYSEVGRGATFKVYLPSAGRPASVAGPADAEPDLPTGAATVLVVEDDEQVRGLTRMALETLGYTVLEAGGGKQAVRVAVAHGGPIDLLVTDVVMPGMSGREVAETVRAARPGVRVLFVSGYTDDAVVRHGVLTAEMAFLQKPFTLAALGGKVREVLDRPASESRLS